MAYNLSNKCAKNLCKQTVLLQLIVENVVTFFWNMMTYNPHQFIFNFFFYIFCSFHVVD